MTLAEGVDSIDATEADGDLLGHGYLFHTMILEDIERLLETNSDPAARAHVEPVPAEAGRGAYWRLVNNGAGDSGRSLPPIRLVVQSFLAACGMILRVRLRAEA